MTAIRHGRWGVGWDCTGGGEEGTLGNRQASHGLDLVAVNRMIE